MQELWSNQDTGEIWTDDECRLKWLTGRQRTCRGHQVRSVTSLAADGHRHSADEGYYNLIHVHPPAERTAGSVQWLMKEPHGAFQMSSDGSSRVSHQNKQGWEVGPTQNSDKITLARKERSIEPSSPIHTKTLYWVKATPLLCMPRCQALSQQLHVSSSC